jgi:hypothetical protein
MVNAWHEIINGTQQDKRNTIKFLRERNVSVDDFRMFMIECFHPTFPTFYTFTTEEL